MRAPQILGNPIWIGNKKRRLAKKKLGWRWRHYLWASSLKPGDLVNDCSGFNVRIIAAHAQYSSSGYGWFDLENDRGGFCSLESCGVEPALSYEKIVERHTAYIAALKKDERFQQDWLKTLIEKEGREFWVSTIDPDFGSIYLRPEAMTINPDGTRTVHHEWVDARLQERLDAGEHLGEYVREGAQ